MYLQRSKVLLVWLFSVGQCVAQYNTEWISRYNGTGNDDDIVKAMVIDHSNNTILTGRSIGTGSDWITIKYDSYGDTIWTARYDNGEVVCRGSSIATDTAGNVFVTGDCWPSKTAMTFKYDISGDTVWRREFTGTYGITAAGTVLSLDNSGNVVVGFQAENPNVVTNSDIEVVKYNSSGVLLWAFNYPQNPLDEENQWASSIKVDNDDNIYIGAYSLGIVDSIILLKLDSAGTQQWARSYPINIIPSTDNTMLELDQLGNVYIAGRTAPIVPPEYDYITIKYDSNGNFKWVQTFDGLNGDSDYAYDITVDPFNNLIITGRTETTQSLHECTTIKYDSLGTQTWIRRFSEPDSISTVGYNITTDNSGFIYITGSKRESVGGMNDDLLNLIYDPNGNLIWVSKYDGPALDHDEGTLIALADSGCFHISGRSVGFGTGNDIITARYCPWPASVNELVNNSTISIYPNPTEGVFTVQRATGEIQVYDLFGRKVLTATEPQIDMRGYAKGVYFVRVGEVVRKLVLN